MDLPTYTNIWRIEKRLYKLYDLRLPMPLPLVQIGVFLGVFVPWIVLLRVVGVPFESPWHVLYIVPPGVLTWLATRPVIEGKRLTELLLSQGRYLAEPRTWCRLTPIREPREVVIVARVWRRAEAPAAVERAAVKTHRKQQAVAVPALLGTAGPAAEPAPLKPWRRTTRDISHEHDVISPGSDVQPVHADLEHPPATPRLEAPAPGSGKRALASGIRRPGALTEFWQAAQGGAAGQGEAPAVHPHFEKSPGHGAGVPHPTRRPHTPRRRTRDRPRRRREPAPSGPAGPRPARAHPLGPAIGHRHVASRPARHRRQDLRTRPARPPRPRRPALKRTLHTRPAPARDTRPGDTAAAPGRDSAPSRCCARERRARPGRAVPGSASERGPGRSPGRGAGLRCTGAPRRVRVPGGCCASERCVRPGRGVGSSGSASARRPGRPSGRGAGLRRAAAPGGGGAPGGCRARERRAWSG